MNKFLRYATCLLMSLFLGSAMAATVEFDPTVDKGTQAGSSQGVDQVSKGGITLSVGPTGSFGNGQQYRVYKDATFTVKSEAGNITSVVITCTASDQEKYGPGNFTGVTTGTFTYSGETGTWTGNASEFSMVATGAQVRMTKVVVYTDGDSPVVDPVDPTPDPDPDPDPDPGVIDESKGATFDATVNKGTQAGSSQGKDQVTVNGITISVDPTGSFGNGYNYRVYKGSTFKISTTHGTITKVVMTCTAKDEEKYGPGCFTGVTPGNYTYSGEVGTWTGSATEISMVASSNQVRMTTIEVFINGEEPQPELVISGTTPFTGSTVVTITGGSDVYYTLDGSDPSVESNDNALPYSGPFTITESCTVKAYDDGSGLSAEKEFVKEEVSTIENIAAFTALEKGTTVTLKLTNAEVLYSSTSNNGNNQTFVRDASGAVQFYNCGLGLEAKDKVNGTVVLKFDIYNGEPEAVAVAGATNADNLIISKGQAACTPKSIDVSAASQNVNDLVKFAAVTVVESEGKYYATDATGAQVQLYNGFHDSAFDDLSIYANGNSFDVTGILVAFKSSTMDAPIYEIYPIEIAGEGTTPVPSMKEVNTIAEFNALTTGTKAKLNLTNAEVLYSWTSNNGNNSTFVRDATGAIMFYKTALGLDAKDLVNGTVVLQYSPYNGNPQAVAVDETNADELIITKGQAACEPKTVGVDAASANVNDLVKFVAVTVVSDGKDNPKFYATDASGAQVQLYNGFHNADFNDFSVYANGSTYDVTGIIEAYKSNSMNEAIYEILPLEITENGSAPQPVEITEVSTIAEFTALAEGTKAKLTLTNAEVVKSWTSNNGNNNTFVRDASGAIQFYNCGLGLETGDLVNGTVVLQYKVYNGEPEAVAVAGETNADELIITKGQAACEPKAVGVDAAAENVNDLVTFSGVTVVAEEGTSSATSTKYYATDEAGNRVQIYNGFHDTAFDQLENFADGKKYDVTGVIVAYQSKSMTEPIYEVYPMEIKESAATGIEAVTAGVLDVNAPVYNLSGQKVSHSYKGVVIQNGKKFIVK